jgi:tRNAThr (cytosine32-N3)-methyltransferase
MASSAAIAEPLATEPEKLADEVSDLKIKEENEPEVVPPHRSHDPQYNQKRSDPFQFGSRYLEAGDDVFEFNAWDHVETDDAYQEYAEQQYEMQRNSPVSDFDKCMLFSREFSNPSLLHWRL